MQQAPSPRIIPFGWKLMATYAAIVLLAIVSLGTYSYRSALQTLEFNTRGTILGTLEQIKDNIVYKMEEYTKVADLLYQDLTLQSSLQGEYGIEQTYLFYTKVLNPRLESAIKITKDYLWLTLYTSNESLSEVYYLDQRRALPTGQAFEIRHMSMDSDTWYARLNPRDIQKKWMEVELDHQHETMSLISPLIDFDNLRSLGWLRISVKKASLFGAVGSEKIGGWASILIIDQPSNNVLYSSAPNEQSELQMADQSPSPYLIVEQEIPQTNWLLAAYIPKSELLRDAVSIRRATLLVCALSFIVIMLISGAIANVLTKRIGKISKSIDAVKEGNFYKRIYFKSNDEFGLIAASFNDMASTIEHLIDEVYVSNLRKKEAELEMLQHQINPHFLYNTLSTISRLAKLGELDNMHEMVLRLAKFYRLVMNTGQMLIPFTDEFEQVKAYVEIQEIKYGGAVTTSWNIADDIAGLYTLKLIMQPFIENIYMHAWHKETLEITISCSREGDDVNIEIADNGCGMTADTVERLNHSPRVMGYGVGNVAERIQLQFGAGYGIQIASRSGQGTTVRICVPVVENVK